MHLKNPKFSLNLLLLFFIFFRYGIVVKCDEFFCNINSKKILHKVSDKFLSISIDPAVLLAGVNLSDTSLLLAQKLSPSLIRLAGPSTPFVKYIDDEEFYQQMAEKNNNVYVTPSMWFGINEWFKLANLTPVFAVNDVDRDNGVWDPRKFNPLIELSDKFEVGGYWQLGYDCSNKTLTQYVEDLSILKQVLSKFSHHRNAWKIIGSDLSKCLSNHVTLDSEVLTKIDSLGGIVDGIVLEQSSNPYEDTDFYLEDTTIPLWISVPKNPKPVTFSSAILWAKQVGEAARNGYDVIFRQPRLKEISHVTPVYWFSLLHKNLMGTTVLDIKPTTAKNSDTLIFAHCTKNQNDFPKSGAVTILAVNDDVTKSIAKIRISSIFAEKTMEVQFYVLTSHHDDSTEIFLNEKKLTKSELQNFTLTPKLRLAKVLNHISLEIPPKSIAFFILTEARLPVCINSEERKSIVLAEISREQEKSKKPNLEPRKLSLENIKNQMLEELKTDNKFYNLKQKDLQNQITQFKGKSPNQKPDNSFKLSIKETENILKERAKQKALEKHVDLTSAEVDMIVQKATINLPKKLFSKREIVPKRLKRHINKVLLNDRADFYKNNMFSQETFGKIYKANKMHKKRNSSKPKRLVNQQPLNFNATIDDVNNKSKLRTARDINFDLLKKRTHSFSEKNDKTNTFISPLEKLFHPGSILSRNKLSDKDIFEEKENTSDKAKKPSLGLIKNSKVLKNKNSKEKLNLDFDSFDFFDNEFSYIDDIMLSPELTVPKKKKAKNEQELLEEWKNELKNKEEKTVDNFDFNYNIMRKKREIKVLRSLTKKELRLKRKTIKKELKEIKDVKKKYKDHKSKYFDEKKQYLRNKIHKTMKHKSPDNIMEIPTNKPFEQIQSLGITQFLRPSKVLKNKNIKENTVSINKRKKRALVGNDLVNNAAGTIKSTIQESPLINDFNNALQNQVTDTILENINPINRFSVYKNPLLTNNIIGRTVFGSTIPKSPLVNDINNAIQNQITHTVFENMNPINSLGGLSGYKNPLLRNNIIDGFGTYQPLSTGLRAWKPTDILNLYKFNLLNPLNMVLRKRRHVNQNDLDYFENLLVNSRENEILSKEVHEKDQDIYLKTRLPSHHSNKSIDYNTDMIKNSTIEEKKIGTGLDFAKNVIDITTSQIEKGIEQLQKKLISTTESPILGQKNVVNKFAENSFSGIFNREPKIIQKAKKAIKNEINDLFGADLNENIDKTVQRKESSSENEQQVVAETHNTNILRNEEFSLLGHNNPVNKVITKTKHFFGKMKQKLSSFFEDII